MASGVIWRRLGVFIVNFEFILYNISTLKLENIFVCWSSPTFASSTVNCRRLGVFNVNFEHAFIEN